MIIKFNPLNSQKRSLSLFLFPLKKNIVVLAESGWAEWRRQNISQRTVEKHQTYLRAKTHTHKKPSVAITAKYQLCQDPHNIWSHRSGPHYLWDFICCPVSSRTSYSFSQMRSSCVSDSPERFTANCSHTRYSHQVAWLHTPTSLRWISKPGLCSLPFKNLWIEISEFLI